LAESEVEGKLDGCVIGVHGLTNVSRLLAILIGRLGLTVQQAEIEYLRIMGYITSAPVDNTGIDRMLKAISKKYTGDSDTSMYDPNSPTSHCKM
jgi:hypothetical protein